MCKWQLISLLNLVCHSSPGRGYGCVFITNTELAVPSNPALFTVSSEEPTWLALFY
jgi:hypothetical protein